MRQPVIFAAVMIASIFVDGCRPPRNQSDMKSERAIGAMEDAVAEWSGPCADAAKSGARAWFDAKSHGGDRESQVGVVATAVSKVEPSCVPAFITHFTRARAQWLEILTVEYAMEMAYLRGTEQATLIPQVRAIYAERMADAGLSIDSVDATRSDREREAGARDLMTALFTRAYETGHAMVFGRFVFNSYSNTLNRVLAGMKDERRRAAEVKKFFDAHSPETTMDYEVSSGGVIAKESSGAPSMVSGSYVGRLSHIARFAYAVANEYHQINWGTWFGRHRFKFQETPPEAREIDQKSFDQRRQYVSYQLSDYNVLQMAPELYKSLNGMAHAMLGHERAMLTRSIEMFDQFQGVKVYLLPILVPVGIYAGALVIGGSALLTGIVAKLGISAVAASTMISVGAMAAYTGAATIYNVVGDAMAAKQGGVDYGWFNAADSAVMNAYASLRSGAIAPIAVPTLIQNFATLPQAPAAMKAAIVNGFRGAGALPSVGLKGVLANAWGGVTRFAGTWNVFSVDAVVANGAQKQLLYWGSRNAIAIGTELITRAADDRPGEGVWVEENGKRVLNRRMLVTLTSGLIGSSLGAPVAFEASFEKRFVTILAIGTFSSVASQMIVAVATGGGGSRGLSGRRLAADLVYKGTAGGMVFSEASRLLKLNPAVMPETMLGVGGGKALSVFVMQGLIESSIRFLEAPVRNWWLRYFLNDNKIPVDAEGKYLNGKAPSAADLEQLRQEMIVKWLPFLDPSDYPDDVLREALRGAAVNVRSGNLPDYTPIFGSRGVGSDREIGGR